MVEDVDIRNIKAKVLSNLLALEEEYWHILYLPLDDDDASKFAKHIVRVTYDEIKRIFENYEVKM